ncbi:deoxyguanosinetriphosphate triphosphohydrolase [Acidobacteriota bacterium]
MSKTIRETLEEQEAAHVHPRGQVSSKSRGRLRPEEPCEVRTAFMRDRDRILHSKSFRRLKHKAQVFLAPEGDHYRTRLTHTLEVSQIARTISQALRLNETLTEAIALGHDLGHTPFGHAGETVLNEEIEGGFIHYKQSMRIVDYLENEGQGLNLTLEVRDGILKHSKGRGDILSTDEMPLTLESEVVRLADLIAYVNHDIDDAARAGIPLSERAAPEFREVIEMPHSSRISMLVMDVIHASLGDGNEAVRMSSETLELCWQLREFLFDEVYHNELTRREFRKAEKILVELIRHFRTDPSILPKWNEKEDLERRICDFVAGMTDRFALSLFSSLFIPKPWRI